MAEHHNRWGLPNLGLGLGLRSPHVDQILEEQPALGFFELLSENYLTRAAKPNRILDEIKERYPLVMHGVSLSVGSTDPLDLDYLRQLKALADRSGAAWVSDHLSFTFAGGQNSHDLLPLPYTEEALRHTAARVRQVADLLERPFFIENPSSYLSFKYSTMAEHEFLLRLMEESGCGMLLDVNNVYVSAYNHGFDAAAYLDAIPGDRVVQIHLAGHTHKGTHLLDTHDDHVVDEVWALYRRVVERIGPVSTLIEWDDDLPNFEVLYAELMKAKLHGGGALDVAI
ncbi:MAG: DUF692 domain-containing protein [Deltaproteobacteria bacterium]|nr:DUF692 domain-containing protein [Deltaproteobacteria bacterium]